MTELADESHPFGRPPRQRRGGGGALHAGAGGVSGRAVETFGVKMKFSEFI